MSATFDATLRKLNDCGCCEGVSAQTPSQVYNRPGLKAIAYRAGVHEQFKETMLAGLSATNLPDLGMKTRENDDFSIALLDSWAAVCDVLTFYQERIANESYLRTATERRSVLELGRTIGYELNPGVAANVYLAFDVDESPGSPLQITLDKGLKVQSIPGPGELPQTFETIESIEARAEWNAIKPKLTELRMPDKPDSQIYLKGINTNLKKGDPLLFIWEKKWDFRRVSAVEADPIASRTVVRFDPKLEKKEDLSNLFEEGLKVYAMRLQTALFGHNAQKWESLPDSLRFGYLDKNSNNYDPAKPPSNQPGGAYADGIYLKRKDSWADAYFYPSQNQINLDSVYTQVTSKSWLVLADHFYIWDYNMLFRITNATEQIKADFGLEAKTTRLDIVGENIWMFRPRSTIAYVQSEELALAEQPLTDPIYGNEILLSKVINGLKRDQKIIISGKRIRARITKIPDQNKNPARLVSDENPNEFRILGLGEELIVVEPPIDIPGFWYKKRWHLVDEKGFDGFLMASWLGKKIKINSGMIPMDPIFEIPNEIELIPSTNDDELISEFALIQDIIYNDHQARLILTQPTLEANDRVLKNIYDRSTVTISANVAHATHGETVDELLGGGDGSQANQRFVLNHSPLTYISSQTPSGSESTLQVRVNDLLWNEVPTLYNRSPEDHVYVARTDDDGKTTVQFGDGHKGARLPSGQNNVSAIYRKGIGLGGLVKAAQINLLMSRPLGLKSAVNPLPSSGAQDRQTLADARRNAPLTVLTLDRAVSLQDYEDYARAFAGVAKALATWTWNGERRAVLVTVAGPKGYVIKKIDATYQNLLNSLRKFGDQYVPLMLSSYRPVTFRIRSNVKVNPEYQADRVFAALELKLRDYFSFDARNFGQAVTLSEVIAVMQNMPGVIAVSIKDNDLYRTDGLGRPGKILEAAMPKAGEKTIVEAELLTLDSAPIDLKVMA
jgi:hypothetical protein